MREEYDATGDTGAAVVRGIAHTGRLVTGAALIRCLAFASLASGPQPDLEEPPPDWRQGSCWTPR
jgi:hypothetical protein